LFHADQGSHALTGQDVNFLSGPTITADQGSYVLTGQAAGLKKGYRLDAQFGGYSTSGNDVEFVVGVGLFASAGNYVLTGQDVTFSIGRGIIAETGSYSLNGQNANLLPGGIIHADTGNYALTGQDVTLSRTRVLRAETGYYTLGGQIGVVVPPAPIEDRPAGGYGWGGFDIRRKKRKKYYEELPTAEDVIEEKIRLQALPKKVQKAVNKVIEKASGVQTKDQATNLAAAYFEEEQQRRLLEMLRKEIASSKSKWQDEVFTVAHAMILDELQKRADREALMKMIADRQSEESEINEVLELWMNL
jgi:hypothetical protein